MKRNYLVKTNFERFYFEEYNQQVEELILEYFKFKSIHKTIGSFTYNNKHVNSIEQFIYLMNLKYETEKNSVGITGIEKRGFNFHLDHIIPISYGFNNGIDYKLIGSTENLQILPRLENQLKKHYITDKALSILDKYKPERKPYNKLHSFEREGDSKFYKSIIKIFGKEFIKIEDDKFISVYNLNNATKIKDIKYR